MTLKVPNACEEGSLPISGGDSVKEINQGSEETLLYTRPFAITQGDKSLREGATRKQPPIWSDFMIDELSPFKQRLLRAIALAMTDTYTSPSADPDNPDRSSTDRVWDRRGDRERDLQTKQASRYTHGNSPPDR